MKKSKIFSFPFFMGILLFICLPIREGQGQDQPPKEEKKAGQPLAIQQNVVQLESKPEVAEVVKVEVAKPDTTKIQTAPSGQNEVNPVRDKTLQATDGGLRQPISNGVKVTQENQEKQEQKPKEEAVSTEGLTEEKNVSLDFKDADIRNVLRIIAYKSKINIVATPEVIGNVSIRLIDVPWEKALDTIVKTYGFGYEWLNNKVIMVSTLEKLSLQRKAEEEAAVKEPLDTQAFTLNYSKVSDMKVAIEKLISSRGKITMETRTNNLIITDTKSNLVKVSEIIKELDKATPQVMIEARIIETSLGNAEKLGIDWTIRAALTGSARPTTFPFTEEYTGVGQKYLPRAQSPSSLERTTTTTTNAETGGVLSTTTTEQLFHKLARGFPDVPTGNFLFGALDFSQVQAVLEILNSRTDTKILSNPRITTLNNQEASILVGTIVPIPEYEYSKDTGTRVVSGYFEQKIGVGLTVTPTINEESFITLNIKPTIDEITGFTGPNNERPIVATRNAETNVMIKDGQTIVIGGLIAEKKIKFKKKIPILGDIPVLDYIFSKKEETVDRTELLIFITPHIITEKDTQPREIAKWQELIKANTEQVIVSRKKKRKF